MPKLTVYDRKGKKVGTYNVEPTDFAPRINKQLLHDAVVMYQTNLRQGSHETRSRGMVAGSTKKMYRQKGTGNARAGSKRSGIRKGGGHIHRIHNRDYSYRLPRKACKYCGFMTCQPCGRPCCSSKRLAALTASTAAARRMPTAGDWRGIRIGRWRW